MVATRFRVVLWTIEFRCDVFAHVYAVKIGLLTALGLSEPLQPSHDELSCTPFSFPFCAPPSIRFDEVNRPRLQAGQPEVVIACGVPCEFVEKLAK